MISLNNVIQANTGDARQFVYQVLSYHIRNMLLLPDEKLSEVEVSQQLGLSRTPVHDTFVQLSRERMLVVESRRGTFVPRLDSEYIKQLIWMNQTMMISILENLYIIRPSKQNLDVLKKFVESELVSLDQGDLSKMADLDAKFYSELYRMAGFLPLYQTLWRNSIDLYRLSRMEDNPPHWNNTVAQHMEIVNALIKHDHESACSAVNEKYKIFDPLLGQMLDKNPNYFK